MALSALTTASKVCIHCPLCHNLHISWKLILSQANLDASIEDLIIRIEQAYELILQNKSSSKINAKRDVIVEIAQVIQECAQFIATYSDTTNFCTLITPVFITRLTLIGRRLGKNVFSETAAKVANYNMKLDKLMQGFRDHAFIEVQYNVQQIWEGLSLDFLACAGRVGLNKEKKCLSGTRTEILKEVVDWINNTDATTPRIFWLHGQAGTGKSAIAHTIALQAENLGLLGSCFCFTRVRQHEGLHMKLFPTIARDLADRDLRLRPLLAEVITNKHSLGDTEDIGEQWHKFIFQPLSQLEGFSTGNVVVVIDALDESGAERTRSTVLKVLAGHNATLPANLRILLTSRPLADIREVLDGTRHVRVRSLDDIDTESTIDDIRLYVSERLKNFGDTFSDENLQHLAAKSGGVFEWARLAGDFVSSRISVIAEKRLEEILSQAPGDGRTLLDEMYTTFLKEFTKGPSDALDMFRSVMRQILWLKDPLSISALDFIRKRFPRQEDHYPVGDILNSMAPLLSGTSEASTTPVRPLHASFYDFLLDEKRSGVFFIQEGNMHHDLTLALLSIMQAGLSFNICGLETSYLPNMKVVDLEKRIEKIIPPYLLYACRFWAIHLQDGGFDVELAQSVSGFVTGEKLLFWLEVLGICKLIREADQALTSAERWFQVRSLLQLDTMYNMLMLS